MNEDTLILKKGYNTSLSMGSLSTPIFKSSTFCFNTAEEGARSFEIAYGLDKKKDNEDPCLIYSRVNNPNMQILEEKMSVLDNSECSLVFSSGMGAISNTCMTFLKPGDTILFNEPVYGGTEFLFNNLLPNYDINCKSFSSGIEEWELKKIIKDTENLKMVYVETPCNPLNKLTSIKEIKKNINSDVILIVDNTFSGPFFLKPLLLGADLVIHSITKFIGGHNDLIAGSVSGRNDLIGKIKITRTIMGTILDSETCWLIQRSLSTLKLRMKKQCENAKILVNYLKNSKFIKNVYYPGISEDKHQLEIYRSEYIDSGSLISFEINGGKEEAFKILNEFKIIRLAVSLGSVDTLIQHPSSMTHSDMTIEHQKSVGINESLLRCSIGIEDIRDIINDFEQSFEKLSI